MTGARAEGITGVLDPGRPACASDLALVSHTTHTPHRPPHNSVLDLVAPQPASCTPQAKCRPVEDVLVGGAAELPAAGLPASKRRRRGLNRAWTGVDLDPCCTSCFFDMRKKERTRRNKPPTVAAAIPRGGRWDGALALTACNPPTPIPRCLPCPL